MSQFVITTESGKKFKITTESGGGNTQNAQPSNLPSSNNVVSNILSKAGELVNPKNFEFNTRNVAIGGPAIAPARVMMSGVSKELENVLYPSTGLKSQVDRLPNNTILPQVQTDGDGILGKIKSGYNKVAESITPRNTAEFLARQTVNPENMAISLAGSGPVKSIAGKAISILDSAELSSANKAISSTMREVIKPTSSGIGGAKALSNYDKVADRAVKAIVNESDGVLPTNRQEFYDSIGNTLRKVWSRVESKVKNADYLKLNKNDSDVSSLIGELKKLRDSKKLSQPEYAAVRKELNKKIGFYENTELDASLLQDRIQTLHNVNQSVYTSPDVSRRLLTPIDMMEVNRLGDTVENILKRATGKSAVAEKQIYGDLKTIQKDVGRSAFRDSGGGGLTDTLFDLSTADSVINFATGGGWDELLRAGLKRSARGAFDRFTSPDKKIESMFKKASIFKSKPIAEPTTPLIGYTPPTPPAPPIESGGLPQLPAPTENTRFVMNTEAQAKSATRNLIDDMKRRIASGQNPRMIEQRFPEQFGQALDELKADRVLEATEIRMLRKLQETKGKVGDYKPYLESQGLLAQIKKGSRKAQ